MKNSLKECSKNTIRCNRTTEPRLLILDETVFGLKIPVNAEIIKQRDFELHQKELLLFFRHMGWKNVERNL